VPIATRTAAAGGRGITPVFPLLLLRTMRDMDRPEEVLEDEDLTLSMPRRLGLSDVVGRQIHRLEEEVRRRQRQTTAEVLDLVRLVVRRPDAEAIFREAGRRIARDAWEDRRGATRRALRWMPRPIALATAVRASRRLLRHLIGDARLRIQRKPLEMRIDNSLTGRADPSGTACSFYSGVLEELLQQYTGRRYRVLHECCEALGADVCEWTVRVAS
jgi:predicted hydrocarbon binding protein